MRHSNSILIHLVKNISWPAMHSTLLATGLICHSLGYSSVLHGQEPADKAADSEQVMPEKAAAGAPSQLKQMDAIASELKSTETTWLGEDKNRFISLYRPALEPSQMALVLLPDSLHKLTQANLMLTLYQELPRFGWSTLNIAMPKAQEIAPPINTFKPSETAADSTSNADTENPDADTDATTPSPDPDANKDDSENTTVESEDKNIALERIVASNQFLLDKDIKAVTYVAEHLTAQAAIKASIEQKDTVSGLVLWQVKLSELPIEQLKKLNESLITILDIVYYDISPEERRERIRLFKMAGFDNDYRLITSPHGQAGFAQSQRRVRQWLETSFQKY